MAQGLKSLSYPPSQPEAFSTALQKSQDYIHISETEQQIKTCIIYIST